MTTTTPLPSWHPRRSRSDEQYVVGDEEGEDDRD